MTHQNIAVYRHRGISPAVFDYRHTHISRISSRRGLSPIVLKLISFAVQPLHRTGVFFAPQCVE